MLITLAPSSFGQTPQELQRIRNAETMTYAGRCTDAIASLRDLYLRYPGNERVSTALKNAFICSKDYDSAAAIIQHQIESTGDPNQRAIFQIESANLRFKQNDIEGGKKIIDAAIKGASTDPALFDHAADVFMMNGYYTDAIKFLQDSRQRLNMPDAFARKLAQLFEIIRNYGDAAREYFNMVQGDSTAEIFITGRIANLIKLNSQEEFDTGLEKALSDLIRSHPKDLAAHRFYGDYLIGEGNYDEAFARFKMVDSLEGGRGKNLLYFARIARDNGADAMVDKACSLIARLPNSPVLVQSRFILAESLYRRGSYQQSASIYQEILKGVANERDIADALYLLGIVTLHGLHQPEEAIAIFDELGAKYPRLPLSASAKMHIGDCYLAMGDATKADTTYATVNASQMPLKDQESLLFKRAELQFYIGNFAAAREAYSKMMNAFPKSVFVNDCLRRIMLISEYTGMEEMTLQMFASALYSRFKFGYQDALGELAKLKERGGAMLSEIAWLESGDIYSTLDQDSLALAEYSSLISLQPESFSAPIALERKGDIFADRLRDCEQARAMYEQVLLNYSNSLNVEEVRKKLVRTEKLICNQVSKTKS